MMTEPVGAEPRDETTEPAAAAVEAIAPDADATPPADDLAPGSPRAIELGCSCSLLANAAYNAGTVDEPLVDLLCRMHHIDAAVPADEAATA